MINVLDVESESVTIKCHRQVRVTSCSEITQDEKTNNQLMKASSSSSFVNQCQQETMMSCNDIYDEIRQQVNQTTRFPAVTDDQVSDNCSSCCVSSTDKLSQLDDLLYLVKRERYQHERRPRGRRRRRKIKPLDSMKVYLFIVINCLSILKVTLGEHTHDVLMNQPTVSNVNINLTEASVSSDELSSYQVSMIGANITIDFVSTPIIDVSAHLSTFSSSASLHGLNDDKHSSVNLTSSNIADRVRRSNLSSINGVNQSSNNESSSNNSSNSSIGATSSSSSSSPSSISWTAILQSSTTSMSDPNKNKNGALASSAYLTPLPLSDVNHQTSPTESTVMKDHRTLVSGKNNINTSVKMQTHQDSSRPNHQKFLTYQLKRFIDCRQSILNAGDDTLIPTDDTDDEQSSSNYCFGSFDGFNCWLPTAVSTSRTLDCPKEFFTPLTAVDSSKSIGINVTRNCYANGSWDEHVTTYYARYCNFNASVINGDANDMELLERLINDTSKLDSSPFIDVRTTLAFEECIDTVLAKPLPSDRGKL